jgi:hypothetical protein
MKLFTFIPSKENPVVNFFISLDKKTSQQISNNKGNLLVVYHYKNKTHEMHYLKDSNRDYKIIDQKLIATSYFPANLNNIDFFDNKPNEIYFPEKLNKYFLYEE